MSWKTLCALAVLAGAAWGTELRADETTPSGNWLSRWFRFGKPADRKPLETPPGMQPLAMPVPQENARSQAAAACLRQWQVCLQLQQIALETKDDELFQQAEQLASEVWQHYTQVISSQPGP